MNRPLKKLFKWRGNTLSGQIPYTTYGVILYIVQLVSDLGDPPIQSRKLESPSLRCRVKWHCPALLHPALLHSRNIHEFRSWLIVLVLHDAWSYIVAELSYNVHAIIVHFSNQAIMNFKFFFFQYIALWTYRRLWSRWISHPYSKF